MDLSTKSTPFHPPPTPESGEVTEEAIPTLCGPTDLKGEYIEEEFNMVKKEDSEFHHQSYFSHQILSHSPFLHHLLPTTSSTVSSFSYAPSFHPQRKLYPPIPPYSTLYPTLTHPLSHLQSFQHLQDQTLSAPKRKTCSPPKSVKKSKNGSSVKATLLSDTHIEIPQMVVPKPTVPPSYLGRHNENEARNSQFEHEASPVDQINESSSGKTTIDCPVCGDTAIAHFHYGGMCCYSCKAFFRRVVNTYKVGRKRFSRISFGSDQSLRIDNLCAECPLLLISYF